MLASELGYGAGVTIGPGQTLAGSITSVGQTDTYVFSATAGDTVVIQMATTAGELGCWFAVQAPDGSQLGAWNNYGHAPNLPQDGTYTLLCKDSSGTKTGDYTISLIKASGPNLLETGEEGTIQPGETKTGAITVGDLDAYTFSANAGDMVVAMMAATAGELACWTALYGPDGVQVGAWNNYGEVASLPQTGTYVLLCRDVWGTRTGSYSLSLLKTPGFNLLETGEGSTIQPGETKTGAITVGDLDAYTFSANAGDMVVAMMAATAGELGCWTALYGPDGIRVGTWNNYGEVASLPQTGTYVLLCRDVWGTRTGSYSLSLIKTPGPNLLETGEGSTIQPGEIQTGAITVGDLDAYTFSANAGDMVVIQMATTAGELHSYVELYGPEGAPVSALWGYDGVASLPQTGTYVLLCRDGSGVKTGSYSLSLIKTPGPNLLETGEESTIQPGETKTGAITVGDLDAYTFSANAGDMVVAMMTATAGDLGCWFALYRPDGTQVGAWWNYSEVASLPQTGTYMLLCRDGSGAKTGSYSLSLIKTPGPNLLETGEEGTIQPGEIKLGTITVGDLDAYTFSGHAGSAITIRTTDQDGSVQSRVFLYGPDHQLLPGSGNSEVTVSHLLLSGPYVAVCRDWNGLGVGTHKLELTEEATSWQGLAITENPMSQTVEKGTALALSVKTLVSGSYFYQWKLNGVNLVDDATTQGVNTSVLHLSNLQEGDQGLYTVLISEGPTSLLSAAALVSIAPPATSPRIAVQPQPQSVRYGGSAAFSVTASGTPPLAYQWQKDGIDLPDATNSHYAIAIVRSANAGAYTVTISNGQGSVVSDATELTVLPGVPHRALASVQVLNGSVVGVTLSDLGFGYSTEMSPAVRIHGSGSGASAHAVVRDGLVEEIVIDNPGTGYDASTTVLVAQPPFSPSLSIAVSKVKVTMTLVLGRKYQLMSSHELTNWVNEGVAFVAESESLVMEFDAAQTGRFFKIQEAP